jgi:hypothetical protein
MLHWHLKLLPRTNLKRFRNVAEQSLRMPRFRSRGDTIHQGFRRSSRQYSYDRLNYGFPAFAPAPTTLRPLSGQQGIPPCRVSAPRAARPFPCPLPVPKPVGRTAQSRAGRRPSKARRVLDPNVLRPSPPALSSFADRRNRGPYDRPAPANHTPPPDRPAHLGHRPAAPHPRAQVVP